MDVRTGDDMHTVTNDAQLAVLLEEATDSERLVFLLAKTGALGVGVGDADRSVLLYNPSGAPAPMHGLGDPDAGEGLADPPLTFDGREFFARCAVPRDVARQAAREFLASNGMLPTSVVWEAEQPVAGEQGFPLVGD